MKQMFFLGLIIASSFVLLFLWSGGVLAGPREEQIAELKLQIEQLEKESAQYQNNISAKRKEANTLQREISILDSSVAGIEKEIALTIAYIHTTELEILDIREHIFETETRIADNQKTMGVLMSDMYENDRANMVVLFLRTNRISDFASQAQHIQTLNSSLRILVDDLKDAKFQLEVKRDDLVTKRAQLEELNSQQMQQRDSLQYNKERKDILLGVTKGEEAEYQKLLNETEQKKAEFFAELRQIESDAVAKGAFLTKVTAKSVPPAGTVLFEFPYDKYTVTQGYGMTSFAKSGAYGGQPHNGGDIAAGCGTPIQSIGPGVVLMSGYNNGYGNWVAVRHINDMVSVYAHMKSPAVVGNGQEVTADTAIGFEGTTGFSTGCHVHLALYTNFFTYVRESNGQIYFNYFDGSVNPFNYMP